MRRFLTLALVFWTGGVTNVLLWLHSRGQLTTTSVCDTLRWPWYAARYVLYLVGGS